MGLLSWLNEWLRPGQVYVARVNHQFAAYEAHAAAFAETCPICTGTDVFLCPDCDQPIKTHTHENDYMCDCWPAESDGMYGSVRAGSLRDVDPIRQSDGAVVIGDGQPGPVRVRSDA